MRLEKETAIYQPGAISEGIGAVEDLAESKNSVYYQASAPSGGVYKENDVWYDSDGDNAMYKWDGTQWVLQQFGTNAIVAGSITTAKLAAQDVYTNFLLANFVTAAQASFATLSAITADIGTVTAGILSSSDWAFDYDTPGTIYPTAGMRISLTDKYIRTPNFAVVNGNLYARNGTFSGSVTANAGAIGAWGINDYQISYYDAITSGTASTQYGVFVRSKEDATHAANANTYHFCVYHRSYNGSTYGDWVIDWGVKHDGSFVATKGSISGGIITSGIDAGNITAGTLSADRIAANSIAAGKLNVSTLSAITADLGAITAGSMNIGSGAFTVSSAGVLSATGATISGALTATSGNIGGFSIENNYQIVYRDTMTAGTPGTQYATFMRATDNGSAPSSTTAAFGVVHRSYDGINYGSWINDFIVQHGGDVYCYGGRLHIADYSSSSMGEIIFSTGTIGAASDGIVINSQTLGIDLTAGRVRAYGRSNGLHLGLTISSTNTDAIVLSENSQHTIDCTITGNIYLTGLTSIDGNTAIMGTLQTSGNINVYNNTATSYAVGVQNSVKKVQLYLASNGNMGVYNATDGHYVVYEDDSNVIRMPQVYAKTNSSAANIYIDSYGRMYRSTASSKRFKKDIKTLKDYKKVLDIPVVQFAYRKGYLSEDDQRNGLTVPGLIAEDVDTYYPIAAERQDGKVEDWNIRYIVPPMLAVEQDHERRIAELEAERARLKGGAA